MHSSVGGGSAQVGVAGVATMVVSAAAPLMVLAGVAPLALSIAGPAAAVGYLLAGGVLALFSVGFTAMCARVPRNGAFHVYVRLAFGHRAGAAAAAVGLTSYNALQVGVWGLLAVQVRAALDVLVGVAPPWWVVALVGVALVHVVARLGISIGVRVLCVLVGLECALLTVLAGSVLLAVGPGGWSWAAFDPGAWVDPGFFAVLGICFAAFMGFESTALYRDEARRPRWTIPRATFAAVGFMALFDFAVVWSVPQAHAGRVPEAAGEHGAALFLVIAREFLGPSGESAMFVLVVTSAFASQLAFHNAINRYTATAAREGLLPRALAAVDARTRAPVAAGRAQSALAFAVVAVVALVGADPYRHLLLWVNTPGVVGILVLETAVAVAAAVWLRAHLADVGRVVVACSWAAALLLAGVLALLVANLDLFSAAGPATNLALLAVVPATAAAAYLAASRRGPRAEVGPVGLEPTT